MKIKLNKKIKKINKVYAGQGDQLNSPILWPAIIRGTWEDEGLMAPKVCGLGADGRMALGMFWKSENRRERLKTSNNFLDGESSVLL